MTHATVYRRFAADGYPQQMLNVYPRELQHEFRKAIDRLLTVVEPAGHASHMVRFVPPYAGDEEAGRALMHDVTGVIPPPVAIATVPENWRPPAEALE